MSPLDGGGIGAKVQPPPPPPYKKTKKYSSSGQSLHSFIWRL